VACLPVASSYVVRLLICWSSHFDLCFDFMSLHFDMCFMMHSSCYYLESVYYVDDGLLSLHFDLCFESMSLTF
jgi:hypothetical protein